MNRTPKVDGRIGHVIIAENYEECGSMGDTTKTAPGGAPTPTESLTEPIGGSAMAQSTEQRRRIAGEYLTRARDDFEAAARTRIRYAIMAREHGLTNADIGTFLGITEGAVRHLVAKYGGA